MRGKFSRLRGHSVSYPGLLSLTGLVPYTALKISLEPSQAERSISGQSVFNVLNAQQTKDEEWFYYLVGQPNGSTHRQRQPRHLTAIACALQLL